MKGLDKLKSTWGKLKNEQKMAIIATPILLIIVTFIIISDDEEGPQVAKKSDTEIQNEKSIKNIEDSQGTINKALSAEERFQRMKLSEDKTKFTDNDLKQHEHRSIFNTDSILNATEEKEEMKEPETKIVYVSRRQPKNTKPRKVNNNSKPANVQQQPVNYSNDDLFNSYSKYDDTKQVNNIVNSDYIKAIIHNEHKIKSGATVHIRTKEEGVVSGVKLPKNSFLSGIARFTNERVMISIKSMKVNGKIYQTDITAYEEDGLEGLYIPGGINQEIAQDAINQGMNRGLSVTTPIGSINTGGINKKINDAVVTIRNGYDILLKQSPNK